MVPVAVMVVALEGDTAIMVVAVGGDTTTEWVI
jgi:hypothetical protein